MYFKASLFPKLLVERDTSSRIKEDLFEKVCVYSSEYGAAQRVQKAMVLESTLSRHQYTVRPTISLLSDYYVKAFSHYGLKYQV
jgi:hypothetical protein